MEYDFITLDVPCGFVVKYTESGYRLSNGVFLMSSGRDADGCYYGAVGMNGMYLHTGTRYRPIYDSSRQLCAFKKVI